MRKSLFKGICRHCGGDPRRPPKRWGQARQSLFLALFISIFFSSPLFSFPDEEKESLALFSSQPTSFALEDDRFLYAASGSSIFRVDTETFALATDQFPALTDNTDDGGDDLTGDIAGMAIQSSFLFATQKDGDLLIFDLDAVTEDPTTVQVTDGELGPLVADPDTGEDQLYILDKAHNAVIVYDISSETSTSIALLDGLASPVTPTEIAFSARDGSGDKVFITSERGLVFALSEGGSSVSTITISSSNKSLNAAAATPDGSFLLVTDATDNVVHVIDTASNAEIDADSLTAGVNPIALPENSSLKDIVVAEVDNPTDVYAFVSGTGGISVIDLNIVGSSFQQPAVIDFNDGGSDDDEDDPMPASSAPGLLEASGDGAVYAAASNASISVVTENPFVTISTTSLGSSSLTTGATFNLTFQSDETGTYRVLIGGDASANGTELTAGNVDTADIDVTTGDIAYDASLFQEGINRIFVFVTDGDGTVGRDAVDITVDAPPTGVEIASTGFGDEKIFVTFTRLTAADIDHYNIYVSTSSADIATRSDPVGTVDQTGSGETLEAKVTGLINGVAYFIGVEGVDAAGNIGTRTTRLQNGTLALATPEETEGLAGATGEAGCGLVPRLVPMTNRSVGGIVWMLFGLLALVGARFIYIVVVFALFLPSTLGAAELSPQWFSLEFKGGAWTSANTTTRDFLGTFSPMGKVEFGFLYRSKYGVEVGVGFVGAGGRAVGVTSRAVSRDDFSFLMIPIENSFVFRADFKEDQLLVPYVKAGPDYVYFRENSQGTVTTGLKIGFHGAAGLQILLDGIEDLSTTMERSLGVNDVYFTVEGRYGAVNNFGGTGVDLSGLMLTGGVLFEF